MAVRWEQRPSGQLVIEQNADWLVRIFGALCAIPALYFAWFLGLACVEYGAALLRDTDLVYLEGFELVTDCGPDGMPVYRLRQIRQAR